MNHTNVDNGAYITCSRGSYLFLLSHFTAERQLDCQKILPDFNNSGAFQ